jgi:hypothetical protein
VHAQHLPLQSDELLGAQARLQVRDQVAAVRSFQERALSLAVRIAQSDTPQKAVEL